MRIDRIASPKRSDSPTLLLILSAVTALVLSPVLFAYYIRLDDYQHILDNPSLQKTTFSGLATLWGESYAGLYIPVTYSAWWAGSGLAHALGNLRDAAWLFHAMNLVFHLVNVALVFVILRLLLGLGRKESTEHVAAINPIAAWIGALFFALHPVQVESVAWVSEFKGILAGTLGLLGVWIYYRFPSKGYAKPLVAVCFVAAMLAKPSSIVFPGVLLAIDRLYLGRTLKESVVVPAILWVLLVPLVLVTKHLQPDVNIDVVPSLVQRVVIATDAFSFYLGKLVVPYPLILDYGRSPRYLVGHLSGWHIGFSLLLAAAGALMVLRDLFLVSDTQPRGNWRALLSCGWAILVMALLPVLGLVPFPFQNFSTVADRYMYIPLVGASFMVAGIVARTCRSVRASLGVAVGTVVVLSVLSFRQASFWQSTQTLFEHTLAVNSRSYLAHYTIAAEFMSSGQIDLGIEHDLKTLEINPDYLSAQVALGVAWIQKGDYQKAIDTYRSVLAKNPSIAGKRAAFIASIHNNLGMALHRVGRGSEGTAEFRKAVEVDPGSASGHWNLGNAAYNEKRYLDAMAEYEIAGTLRPGDREIAEQLARARRGARGALFNPGAGPSSH